MTRRGSGDSDGRRVAQDGTPLMRAPRNAQGAGLPEAPQDDDLRHLLLEGLRIALKRKGLILIIVLVAVALGVLRTVMTVPLYTASVRLQIEAQSLKIVERGQVEQPDTGDTFLRTQIGLLRSHAMAQRVTRMASLAEDEAFLKPRQISVLTAVRTLRGEVATQNDDKPGKTGREERAAAIVAANQIVRPLSGARLVDVLYVDPVPERAARIANTYAEAFIAANLDRRSQATLYAKAFLAEQLAQVKARLEEAEKAVVAFAEKEEFVMTSERSSIAEANLAAANATFGELVAARIKSEQLWRQVEKANEINLPQLLLNPVIQSLRTTRNTLDGEYKERPQTFKPRYPAMTQLASRIKAIDRQIATEVATLKASHKAAFEQARRQETEMQARLEALRIETLDLQRRGIQYDNLRREAATLRTLYESLLQRHKEVDIAGGTEASNIFIVDRAEAPAIPSSPNLPRALLLSLMLGLIGGYGAAFLLERLDDTVHGPDALEELTALPTLGVIPDAGAASEAGRLLRDPRSGIAEAYRSLCTALQFTTTQGLPRSLLVTSAAPGEGKSLTSMAVARYFASLGLRVLLADADLRNPSLHHRLGVRNSVGLSSYLSGARAAPEAFRATDLPSLFFMPSGPLPSNAADLLASPRLMSLLAAGAESFDLIVLDSPPIMGLADAPLLSNATSATLFVVEAGKTRTGQVRGALKRLQLARSPVVGTVLTRFDARNAPYGDAYTYSYGFGIDRYITIDPQSGGSTKAPGRPTQI